MPFNLIEAVESQVTPTAVAKLGESNGETPNKTRAAVSGGITGIIGGLIHRTSTSGGALSLLSSLRSGGGMSGSSLLGDRADDITDSVARSSGVNRGMASGVMSMLMPIVGGVLGREVISRKLDANGLSGSVQSQKRYIAPGGVRSDVIETAGERDVGIYPATVQKPQRNWLPLVLGGLLALGLLLMLLFRGSKPKMPEVSTPELPRVENPIVNTPELPATPPPAVQEPTGQTETTGAEMAKPSDDISGHLTGNGTLPDKFALPGANFDFATTGIVQGGDASIDKLANAMKEHPTARIRLEGHTDAVGQADVNKPLSYDRATAVKKMLTDRGIAENRIETIGKADADPVAGNDTKDGRAQNRRIDVVVLER